MPGNPDCGEDWELMEDCIYLEKTGKYQQNKVIHKELYLIDERKLEELDSIQKNYTSVGHYVEFLVDKDETERCGVVQKKAKPADVRIVGQKMKRSVKKSAPKKQSRVEQAAKEQEEEEEEEGEGEKKEDEGEEEEEYKSCGDNVDEDEED